VLASVAAGARYVRADAVLVWILVISGTVFVVAGPTSALLPAVAGETLWNGMSWLSLILTAMGAGAFAGAFMVMNVGRFRALGTVGSLLGIHAALAIGGAIALGSGAYATFRVPALRNWRTPLRKPGITPTPSAAVGQPTFR